MFTSETQILQRLAVLVVCHDLAVGQIVSPYIVLQRSMCWFKAREFCQRHYVDLAVLSTEEQYLSLPSANTTEQVSFWLGLRQQSTFGVWKWVNGEELSYERWSRKNPEGSCASLEAKDKKMLARYCEEQHMFVCQGPVSPQPVTVDAAGSDHMILSWNVSAFMQMTPHFYNVTTCSSTCKTHFFSFTDDSAFMSINIPNLTEVTEYIIEISAVVVRPDNVTGGNTTLQSNRTVLHVRKDSCCLNKVIIILLKCLKYVSLVPPLWILYQILKNFNCPHLGKSKEVHHDVLQTELSTVEIIENLIPQKTRGVG